MKLNPKQLAASAALLGVLACAHPRQCRQQERRDLCL